MRSSAALLVSLVVVVAGCNRGGGGSRGGGSTPSGGGGGGGAPSAFSLSIPSDNALGVSTTPSLSWTDSTGETNYTVQVDTDTAFAAPFAYENTAVAANATAQSIAPALAAGTKYYWRVIARNSSGQTTSSPASFSFTTATAGTPPSAFTLVSPANASTITTTTPTLTWTDSTGETSYTVQIDTENTFAAPLTHQNTAIGANVVSYAVQAGVLPGNGTYYWRVIAVNASGQVTASNAPFSFTVSIAVAGAWAKTFGGATEDYGFEAVALSDGSYAIGGRTDSFGSGFQGWILKLSSTGVIQWQKGYGTTGYEDFRTLRATSDGGFIAAGMTNSIGAGSNEFYIVKTDATGNPQWQKVLGTSAGQEFAFDIREVSGGGYIVTGPMTAVAGGGNGYDAWLVRLSSTGVVQWGRRYGDGTASPNDVPYAVLPLTDGFLVAGSTNSFGAGPYDAWLIRTDLNGMFTGAAWQKRYADGAAGYEQLFGVVQDGVNFVACGYAGAGEYLIMKTDAAGVPLWQKLVIDHAVIGEIAQEICVFGNGYLISGYDANRDNWVVRMDQAGTVQWQRTYGGAGAWDEGTFVVPATDGGIFTGGYTQTYGAGGKDLWAIKTASDGSVSGTIGISVTRTSTNFSMPATVTTSAATTAMPVSDLTVTWPATPTNAVVNTQAP